MTINISIGSNPETQVFHALITNAPAAYDGFGTFTVAQLYEPGNRLVLVRDEHLEWQKMRYHSGMHLALDPTTQGITPEGITEILWNRLRGQQ